MDWKLPINKFNQLQCSISTSEEPKVYWIEETNTVVYNQSFNRIFLNKTILSDDNRDILLTGDITFFEPLSTVYHNVEVYLYNKHGFVTPPNLELI